jgi:hypothetical protein
VIKDFIISGENTVLFTLKKIISFKILKCQKIGSSGLERPTKTTSNGF